MTATARHDWKCYSGLISFDADVPFDNLRECVLLAVDFHQATGMNP
jgi:hypothetical protein